MDKLDLDNLTPEEIQTIQKSIIEKWDEEKLRAEYLTEEYIAIRIRNNKCRAGIIEW